MEYYTSDYGINLATLPMEIILQILNYLHSSDLPSASLICRRWFDATQQIKFANKLTLNFSRIPLYDEVEPISMFMNSNRYFNSIIMDHIDIGNMDNFWLHFGGSVRDVTFRNSDLREKQFNKIISKITNLKRLEIDNCRELFMSGRLFENPNDKEAMLEACKPVETLFLRNNRYLSDSLINRFFDIMPNIRILNLTGCHISFHKGLFMRFYGRQTQVDDENITPSESILTFQFILKLIHSIAHQLKELDFSETLIDGTALTSLTEFTDLHLDALKLRSCEQLTNSGIINFVKIQRNLQHLDLSLSVRLTDACLIEICSNLSNLKVLRLRRCRAITDLGIKHIVNLRKLEVLDISECVAITSIGILAGFAKIENILLIELYMSALNICENVVIATAEKFPNLEVLDLSFCKHAVTNLGVQLIFKHLILLRKLDLSYCDKISDAAITGMDMKDRINQYEEYLKEKQNKGVTKDTVNNASISPVVSAVPQEQQSSTSSVGEQPNNVSSQQERDEEDENQLAQLRRIMENNDTDERHPYKISLRSKAETDIVQDAKRKKIMLEMYEKNSRISNECSSGYSIERLKGLRILRLTACNKITDVSLKYSFKFNELKQLSLSKCQQISIIGINSLLKNCKTILSLNLSECHNINDKTIELITIHLKLLKKLSLRGCKQLTDHTLDYIAVNCKLIKRINLRHCNGMCSEPNLRLVNVSSLQSVKTNKLCESSGSSSLTPFRDTDPVYFAIRTRGAPSPPVTPSSSYRHRIPLAF